MAAVDFDHRRINAFSAEDFETASIRSAAPSYSKSLAHVVCSACYQLVTPAWAACHPTPLPGSLPFPHANVAACRRPSAASQSQSTRTDGNKPTPVSEAPSYHTTVSTTETIPPYSPPQSSITNNTNSTTSTPASRSLLPSHTAHIPSPGLPPIPPASSSAADLPSLAAFRIPSWSVNTNPMYQRVATRRAQAAMSGGEGLVRNAARVLERVNEESGGGSGSATPADNSRVRPLEDPYLVGEVAAARARRERLARENTEDILHREDRRWDWFLGKS
jgi:hypothetical protein